MKEQFDKIIDCPKSGGDLCYVIEINKDITNYFSMSCGFWTNSLMEENTEFFNEQMSLIPELYKDIAWKDDDTNLVWLPNHVNIPEQGMVFAEGSSASDWGWAAVKAVEIPEEERTGQFEGKTHKPDMSTIKRFSERDYIDALSYIGILPE